MASRGCSAGPARPQCQTHLQTRHLTVWLRFTLVVLLVFLFRVLLLERALKVLKRVAPRWTEPRASVPER